MSVTPKGFGIGGTRAHPVLALLLFALTLVPLSVGSLTALLPSPLFSSEVLTPAQLQPQTDQLGGRWDLTWGGIISSGTRNNLNSAMMLQVDDMGFPGNRQPMVTSKGEYIFTGEVQNLTVQRRVRLDSQSGAVRWIDVFENKTDKRREVTIKHQVGNYRIRKFLTEDSEKLEDSDDSSVAVFGVQESENEYSYFLCTHTPPDKIELSGRQLIIRRKIAIPAGEKRCLLTTLGQRKMTSDPDEKLLKDLLVPHQKRSWFSDVPLELRRTIVNFKTEVATTTDDGGTKTVSLEHIENLAHHLDVDHDDTSVVVKGDTSFGGKVTGSRIAIDSRFGPIDLGIEEVLVISGGGGRERPMRTYLRSGEVFVGSIDAQLSLKTESGLEVPLDLELIDWLFFELEDGDGQVPGATEGWIETAKGNRVLVTDLAQVAVAAVTPWGHIQASLADLHRIFERESSIPDTRMHFKDGTNVPIVWTGTVVEVNSVRFGPINIEPSDLRTFQQLGTVIDFDTYFIDDEQTPSHVKLVGASYVRGRLDLDAIHLIANGTTTRLDAKLITAMDRRESENPLRPIFELWVSSATNLRGTIREVVIPIRTEGRSFRIPTSHIGAVYVSLDDQVTDEMTEQDKVENEDE